MSHVPHELTEEFPDSLAKIHTLKSTDTHFARLADEYHQVNREIHRIETGVQPSSDDAAEALKRQRLHVKDQIAAILAGAVNG